MPQPSLRHKFATRHDHSLIIYSNWSDEDYSEKSAKINGWMAANRSLGLNYVKRYGAYVYVYVWKQAP